MPIILRLFLLYFPFTSPLLSHSSLLGLNWLDSPPWSNYSITPLSTAPARKIISYNIDAISVYIYRIYIYLCCILYIFYILMPICFLVASSIPPQWTECFVAVVVVVCVYPRYLLFTLTYSVVVFVAFALYLSELFNKLTSSFSASSL